MVRRRAATSYRRRSVRRRPAAQPRRRVYTRRSIRSKAMAPLGLTSISKTIRKVPFIMAHIDPFLPVVRGVKVPDANTMESDTALLTDEFQATITTGTNVKAYAFNPSLTACQVFSTEGVGAWSWGAAYSGYNSVNQLTNVQSSSTAYRTVAHGIRISSALPPTTTTGFLHICVYSPSTYSQTTWPYPVTIGQMRDLPFYRKVTIASLTQSPLTVVNKFLDQTAFRYSSTDETIGGFGNSSNNMFNVTHSWATIIVAIEGAPSGTSPLGIETCVHIETIAKMGATNNSSAAAPPQPAVMDAAANVAANTQASHFESEQGSVFGQASEAIQAAGGAFAAGVREGADTVAENLAHGLRNAGRNAVFLGTGAALNYVRRQAPGIPGVNNQYRLT